MKRAVAFRLDEEKYKEVRKKLLDEDRTFTDLIVAAMEAYIKGDLKLTSKEK